MAEISRHHRQITRFLSITSFLQSAHKTWMKETQITSPNANIESMDKNILTLKF